MAKVSTNISLDADTKARAQVMLADLGLDLSTAVNIFLRQMLYEGGIPFAITREVPNKVTLETRKGRKRFVLPKSIRNMTMWTV